METLKKNYEFKQVLTRGKYYTGQYIQVFMKANKLDKNRIGIAISSKIAKANKRNKAKRLIRENYRLLESQLDKGQDIVFLWKKEKDIKEISFLNIKKDMEQIVKKSGLKKIE